MTGLWIPPVSGATNLADRPAADTLPPGTLWLVLDDDGGTLWRTDGSAWTQAAPGVSETGGGSGGTAPTGASVYQTGVQSIPNATETPIQFDAEYFDDSNYHSTDSNTSRLTMPADGLYLIGGGGRMDTGASSRIIARFKLDGTTTLAPHVEHIATAGGQFVGGSVQTLQRLTAGQYVELIVFHTAGSAKNTSIGTFGCWITRLA